MSKMTLPLLATLIFCSWAVARAEVLPAWKADDFVMEEVVVRAEALPSFYVEEIVVTAYPPPRHYSEEIVVTAKAPLHVDPEETLVAERPRVDVTPGTINPTALSEDSIEGRAAPEEMAMTTVADDERSYAVRDVALWMSRLF